MRKLITLAAAGVMAVAIVSAEAQPSLGSRSSDPRPEFSVDWRALAIRISPACAWVTSREILRNHKKTCRETPAARSKGRSIILNLSGSEG